MAVNVVFFAVNGVFLLFNSLLYTIRLRDINKIRENTQSVCFVCEHWRTEGSLV